MPCLRLLFSNSYQKEGRADTTEKWLVLRRIYSVSSLCGKSQRVSLDDAKWLRHLGQNVRCAQQLFPLVRRTDDRAQPRFSFRNNGITDRGCEYARFKKLLREFERPRCITHVNWDNRRLAHLELKPALLQFALEHFRVGPQFLHQLFASRRIEQRERRLACRRRSRRMRSRKKEWPRPQVQKIDQVARTANVSAHCADCLAQRSHLDVHAPVALMMVHASAAAAAQHAQIGRAHV